MARWHLEDLRKALARKGWSIVEHPGDDYRISARWELCRAQDTRVLVIEFEGLDDMHALPVEQSYGCHLTGTDHGLYFRRRGKREVWFAELEEFVAQLETNRTKS